MFGQHVGLPVFIITAFVFVNATNFKRVISPDNDGNDVRSHVPVARSSRAVTGTGSAVLRYLLKGAKEVPTESPFNRKFLKQGTEDDAISDFNALNCKAVKRKSYGATGVKGNAIVKLVLNDFSRSTIVVSDPNMAKSIKVIYIKKLLY